MADPIYLYLIFYKLYKFGLDLSFPIRVLSLLDINKYKCSISILIANDFIILSNNVINIEHIADSICLYTQVFT